MKKIIIGTLVGTVIFFAYQTTMWVGGLHKDFWIYSANGDKVLQAMNDAGLQEGLYVLPSSDPATTDQKKMHEEMMKNVGKPWAMVFYHPSMHGEDTSTIIRGFIHALLAVLVATMVLYFGGFSSFGSRFLASWAFGIFAICLGPYNDMNWWNFPRSFVQLQVIDLSLGWGICCIWLAWFVKKQ
jgi:hypothetical protein